MATDSGVILNRETIKNNLNDIKLCYVICQGKQEGEGEGMLKAIGDLIQSLPLLHSRDNKITGIDMTNAETSVTVD